MTQQEYDLDKDLFYNLEKTTLRNNMSVSKKLGSRIKMDPCESPDSSRGKRHVTKCNDIVND